MESQKSATCPHFTHPHTQTHIVTAQKQKQARTHTLKMLGYVCTQEQKRSFCLSSRFTAPQNQIGHLGSSSPARPDVSSPVKLQLLGRTEISEVLISKNKANPVTISRCFRQLKPSTRSQGRMHWIILENNEFLEHSMATILRTEKDHHQNTALRHNANPLD